MKPEQEDIISEKIDELYDVKVGKVMDKNFLAIEKTTSVKDIIKKIGNLKVYHIWVVDSRKNNRLIGVVTEEDILYTLREAPKAGLIGYDVLGLKSLLYGTVKGIDDIMTSHPLFCEEKTTLGEVMAVMVEENVNQLPVVNEKGIIIGEITLNKLLNFTARLIEGK